MQKGGDGYVINVNESIGGMTGHMRYSNNYRPIFEGSLLKGGKREDKESKSVYEIVMEKENQKGGFSPFPAIQSLTQILAPLGTKALVSLVLLMGMYEFQVKKPEFKKQCGGYTSSLTEILAPLGKNNLLVVVAILLLHTFTVQQRKKEKVGKESRMKGGYIFEKELSGMLDGLKEGKEYLFQTIRSFMGDKKEETQENTRQNKNEYTHENTHETHENTHENTQMGGKKVGKSSPPKQSYEAVGLIVMLQKLIVYKIKETQEENSDKKKKHGQKVIRSWNELFHNITPISFSAFGTESFLKDVVENKEKYQKYFVSK
jgi:hypothetical protein